MSEVQALLDTSILIDLWRGNPPALQWIRSNSSIVFALPVIACMELVDGARNVAERQQAVKLLQPYPVVHISPVDSAWAQAQHAQYKLSHNVGIGDVLIASAAARLSVPLYTLNTRHFTPLPGVTVVKPY
jgi:predicted nucleic acid-binding protein